MFGFTYEDYDCEVYAINKYIKPINSNKLNCIMILSGGETMFEIAPIFANHNLIAVDFNKEQIKTVENKISKMNSCFSYKKYIDSLVTPFDELFIRIKNRENFKDVFSNENLINKFGSNAVINTSENFHEHFENIYKLKKIHNDKFYNWIFERKMDTLVYDIYKKSKNDINSIKSVNIVCDNILNLLTPDTYDFIQVSNLGDWMNHDDFLIFCSTIKKSLKYKGICVARRLLSDNILTDQFDGCENVNDKTMFYKETIIWQKL